MIQFTAAIQQFREKGDKTGWMYIDIPADLAEQLSPGSKKAFRVKGTLDSYKIQGATLLPMGNGSFILPFNADMRKGTGKRKGAMISLKLSVDKKEYELNQELMACLTDEPDALSFFKSLAPSHQRYFSKWIESAKTEATRTKRIAQAVSGLARQMDFGSMVRFYQQKNQC
ncbi:MAG TPA: YdeI/OmpD-associated family protein [Chitinophagaceae bacterium]|nr:YdeI/OmpD-associated family protein [Chitinophagaceae bacterium]